MEPEAGRVRAVGQGHLGEDLGSPPPGGAQTLEHRTVLAARLGQPGVEAGQVDRVGVRGRPGRGERLGGQGLGQQGSARVPLPPSVGAFAVGARVHADRPDAVVVGGAHPHLDLDRPAPGEHQRLLKGQFADAAAADVVTGPDGEVQERRAGQYRPAA